MEPTKAAQEASADLLAQLGIRMSPEELQAQIDRQDLEKQ